MTTKSTLNAENIKDFTHFLVKPLKIVGCWEWYPKTEKEREILINNVYVAFVLFFLLNSNWTLAVNLHTEWTGIMGSLEKIADGLPPLVSVAIVAYFILYREDLYDLVDFMNDNFKSHSARGLTNMTMTRSYNIAKNFSYVYTACTMFSVTMYVFIPVVIHLLTKQPMQSWIYMDVTKSPFFEIVFLRQCLVQMFVGLAMGQLGVFFASNAILLCGQLDLLCCSLRNVKYTGMLQDGVHHSALVAEYATIKEDERYNYIYNKSETEDSKYHYDERLNSVLFNKKMYFDIYSSEFDEATCEAFWSCARMCQVVNTFKQKFEIFVSPLLALRVIQVTLYLCVLLYAATEKFDMITVEYLMAVALDIFVYCYFGNQMILQADRVSTAAYQSSWHTMGVRPRKMLLNLLLVNRRPVVMRAGRFLPMDLHTFVVIIKTSFSYYTLLVNVNEK